MTFIYRNHLQDRIIKLVPWILCWIVVIIIEVIYGVTLVQQYIYAVNNPATDT